MNTYMILRRHGWESGEDLQKAAETSGRVGREEMPDRVKWIRSYVLDEGDGTLGTACVYQATGPDAVREHARRAGLPCDSVIEVADTLIVNEDPKQQA